MIRFTKQDKLFPVIRYGIRARAKDTIKPSFFHVHVSEKDGVKSLCSSDSRRLHISDVTDTGLETGFYEVIRDTASEVILEKADDDTIGQFPNVWQVFPDADLFSGSVKGSWTNSHFGGSKLSYKVANLGVCVNLAYLEDATKDFECTVSAHNNDDGFHPVIVKHPCGIALIMPIAVTSE